MFIRFKFFVIVANKIQGIFKLMLSCCLFMLPGSWCQVCFICIMLVTITDGNWNIHHRILRRQAGFSNALVVTRHMKQVDQTDIKILTDVCFAYKEKEIQHCCSLSVKQDFYQVFYSGWKGSHCFRLLIACAKFYWRRRPLRKCTS